jgi:hypothetical protein
MLLHITSRVFRLGAALGLVTAVLIAPAAPGNAAAPHVDFTLFALPPALTLGAAHSGLVKAIVHANNTTATHVQVTVTASQPVTLTFTSPQPGCPTPTVQPTLGPTQPLICNLPNINTNSTASVVIQFQSPASAEPTTPPCNTATSVNVPCMRVSSTLMFAEGNGGTNDTLPRSSDIELVGSTNAGGSAGDCFSLGPNDTRLIGTTASATVAQATQASVRRAAGNQPCSPAAVGAKSIAAAGLHLNQAWFVELPTLAAGTTTATLSVFNPPSGVNQSTFTLVRFNTDVYGSVPFNSGAFQTVPQCVNGTLPPNADSCILSVTSLPGSQGGFSISLLVRPSGDASFGG